MDPKRFDTLAKRLVTPATRRAALGTVAASGLSALGLRHAAPETRAAQDGRCVLAFVATVRQGPSLSQVLVSSGNRPGEVRGELSFSLSETGKVEDGALSLPGGSSFPVVGQATGHALQVRIELAPRLALVAVGVGEQEISVCRGAIDGVVAGPEVGDLGDWHAGALSEFAGSGGTGPTGRAAASPPSLPGPTEPTTPIGSTAPTGPTAPAEESAAAPLSTGPSGPTGSPTAAASTTPASGMTDLSAPTGPTAGGAPTAPTGATAPTGPTGTTGTTGPTTETAQCAAGLSRCNGVCVDLASDPNHCGACQTPCASGVCAGGVCGAAAVTCPEFQHDCGDGCVFIHNNPLHCGGCGFRCKEGELCQVGACTTCTAGLTNCGNVCVDLQTDPANCGTCGGACGNVQICQAGVCGSSGDVCPIDRCGNDCVDLQSSPVHCGACGVNCGDGACISGVCLGVEQQIDCVAIGRTNCGGVCVDLQVDGVNCGACGVQCGEFPCISGVCTGVVQQSPFDVVALSCEAMGLTDCGGVCVDLLTDDNNCGSCGHACYPGLCSYGDGTCTVCNDDVVVSGFCA